MNHGYQFSNGIDFKQIIQERCFQRWRERVNEELQGRRICFHPHWCEINTPFSFCGFCERAEIDSDIDAEIKIIRFIRSRVI